MSAATPFIDALGINHVVLNVRDIDVAHDFYVNKVGFVQVGELRRPGTKMRFYACRRGSHHDLALVEVDGLPEPAPWSLSGSVNAVNHFAVALRREAFLSLLGGLAARGVEFAVRGDHGMTHSCYVVDPDGNGIEFLYELQPEIWQDNIDAALNYFVPRPTSGPAALDDSGDVVTFAA